MGQRNAWWLTVALLGAAIGYAYWPALVGMKSMWDNTPMYSFGYIVPVVSAFLIWSRRHELAALEPRPAIVVGATAALVAVALLLGGRIGGVLIAEQLGFVFALVAAVLLVAGTDGAAPDLGGARLSPADGARSGTPSPSLCTSRSSSSRPRSASRCSRRSGSRRIGRVCCCTSRTSRWRSPDACSGVNYLVAILALGVPLGYLYLPTIWRRVLLVTFAIVVAALSNSLRVALIGVLAYFDIGSPLHGPFHVLHGLFVSGIGYVVLFLGLRWLRGPAVESRTSPAAPIERRDGSSTLLHLLPGLVLALAFLAAPIYAGERAPGAGAGRAAACRAGATSSARGPSISSSTPEGRWWQGADDEVRRRYRRPGFPPVDVEIAYFRVQRQGKEIASHLSARLHRAVSTLRLPDARTCLPLRTSSAWRRAAASAWASSGTESTGTRDEPLRGEGPDVLEHRRAWPQQCRDGSVPLTRRTPGALRRTARGHPRSRDARPSRAPATGGATAAPLDGPLTKATASRADVIGPRRLQITSEVAS